MNGSSSSNSLEEDESALIQYYTSSMTVLYDALQTFATQSASDQEQQPSSLHFPLPEVLIKVRPKLLKGWKAFEEPSEGQIIGNADRLRFATLKERHPGFLRELALNMELSEEQCFGIMQTYIRTENPDELRLDSAHVTKIVEFYFCERQRIVDCVTALLRMATESDVHESVTETLRWLVANGLEQNMANLYVEALHKVPTPQQQHEIAAKEDFAMVGHMTFQIEQKIAEQASVLDLLFMTYYNEVVCSPLKFREFLKLFKEHEFGLSQMRFFHLSKRIQTLIPRGICLAMLLICESLNLELIEANLQTDSGSLSEDDTPR